MHIWDIRMYATVCTFMYEFVCMCDSVHIFGTIEKKKSTHTSVSSAEWFGHQINRLECKRAKHALGMLTRVWNIPSSYFHNLWTFPWMNGTRLCARLRKRLLVNMYWLCGGVAVAVVRWYCEWWFGRMESSKLVSVPSFSVFHVSLSSSISYPFCSPSPSLCVPLFSPRHPSVNQGPVSWQAQSCPAQGFLNGLTPCTPRKQRPHFINLSPRGNSFPAWQPDLYLRAVWGFVGQWGSESVWCGTVINSACDQISQKHIKMPLILPIRSRPLSKYIKGQSQQVSSCQGRRAGGRGEEDRWVGEWMRRKNEKGEQGWAINRTTNKEEELLREWQTDTGHHPSLSFGPASITLS